MELFNADKMKTVLYDRHLALGAKMVDFCGWTMPLSYTSIIAEHLAVREKVALFDISHMGRILVSGPDAEAFLDYISTNVILGKADGSATYTVWSQELGGCVDDVIVYRQNAESYFVVVNACNRQKDLEHLKNEAPAFNVTLRDLYAEEGMLALQGPLAISLISRLDSQFSAVLKLKPMQFCQVNFQDVSITISRTGYTGAGGVEIYAPKLQIIDLWDLLLKTGVAEGIMAAGLGARDTLRLEMGYALYGHEINEDISANESVSAWTVKFDKRDFLGKTALELIEESPNKREEHGIVMIEPGIARSGYPVFQEGVEIGTVTSGTQSPTLNKAIAIVLVEKVLLPDELVEIKIRDNFVKAKVVKLPFIEGQK